MELQLNEPQAELLRSVLDSALRELRHEIADTDSPRYRRGLKSDELAIRELLDALGGPLPNPA